MLNALLSFSASVLCGGLALFALARDARSFVHRVFAVGMAALALVEVCHGMSARALLNTGIFFWERLSFVPAAVLPGSWILFSLSYGRSNYEELVKKWKWFIGGSFAFPLVWMALFWDSLLMSTIRSAEFHVSSIPLGWPGYVVHLFFLLSAVVILANLEATLRASTGAKRWRVKFMILGLVALFAMQIYTISQMLLFSSVDLALLPLNALATIVADLLILVALMRHRFLNVDIYISRSVLYNSLTVLLVGSYLLAVGLLAATIHSWRGARVFHLGAFVVFLALLALTVVLLSGQLQQTVKRFISRNFYRQQYDYRNEWTTFTERTTSLMDIRDLASAVVRMVSETFAVASVTIRLLDEASDRLLPAGSTAFTDLQGRDLKVIEDGSAALVRYLRDQRTPVDFLRSADYRLNMLRQSYPDVFGETGIRYAVPLIAGRQFLGVMTLGDRMTHESFSIEDVDLLKTIADQAAGNLLNLQLSERLMKAKELEAFQTLSAFFIHDLKNLASMLSLTMQNLPANYDNPAFRNDTLRVISESVGKMNAMCSRLSLLTRKLDLRQTQTDLNELVTTTLASLNGSVTVSLIQDLRPVPRISVDRDQIQKVLINLVLNATEAVGNPGEIRVSTDQIDGWAVLSVRDNGCGMSKEFIERSLFRPFQTTKSRGMGIGLFHSKKIVEAHHGRIEVESDAGKGSTFRVMLPVTGAG